MSEWEEQARRVCARYRSHPEYEDVLAVATTAAWKAPSHPYLAAKRAALSYLRSPVNGSRKWNRSGVDLPELVPLDEAAALSDPAGDPSRVVVDRLWYEWLVAHPSLTATEREVLRLMTATGASLTEVSIRMDRCHHWASAIVASARKKLRIVHDGGYVPRSDKQCLANQRGEARKQTEIRRTEIRRLRGEGMSLRAIVRVTGYSYPTVQRHARGDG